MPLFPEKQTVFYDGQPCVINLKNTQDKEITRFHFQAQLVLSK